MSEITSFFSLDAGAHLVLESIAFLHGESGKVVLHLELHAIHHQAFQVTKIDESVLAFVEGWY